MKVDYRKFLMDIKTKCSDGVAVDKCTIMSKKQIDKLFFNGIGAFDVDKFLGESNDISSFSTDFALLNKGENQKKDYLLLNAVERVLNIDYIDFCDGNSGYIRTEHKPAGVRPVLKFSLNNFVEVKKSFSLIPKYKITDEDANKKFKKFFPIYKSKNNPNFYAIKLGEYPTSIASSDIQIELNNAFENRHKEKSKLKNLGYFYTANGGIKSPMYQYATKLYPVFEYKGKKYIKYQETYTDGGTWVNVEPVEFTIANYDRLPSEINPQGNGSDNFLMLVASKNIINNEYFAENCADFSCLYKTWIDSSVRRTLNQNDFFEYGKDRNFQNRWSFVDQVFAINRKKVNTYIIPKNENVISNCAFANCENLERIFIGKNIEKIGNKAFENTRFRYLYRKEVGDNLETYLVLSVDYPKNIKDKIEVVDLEIVKQVFPGFETEKILEIRDEIRKFNTFVLKLKKEKAQFPYEFYKELTANNKYKNLIHFCDFRYFANEMKNIKNVDLTSSNNIAILKFAMKLGCFSNDKWLDKNGQPTDVFVAQKASSFLAQLLRKEYESINNMFEETNVHYDNRQEFLKFLMVKGENGEFQNFIMLKKYDMVKTNLFNAVMNEFPNILMARKTVSPNGKVITTPWEKLIFNYFENTNYGEVEPGFEDIASTFALFQTKKEVFDLAVELRKKAIKNNVPHHILSKHLDEKDIIKEINQIKNDTFNELQNSKEILEEKVNNAFTYEFLDKYDPINALIGTVCSCCAVISGTYYGSDIAKATIVAKDVQNLVIRDGYNRIIAKCAFYVNKKQGYIVFNEIEIADKYKKGMFLDGEYHQNDNNPREMDREKIFKTFLRGVKKFIEEYDKENPMQPIQTAVIGKGYNKLKKQCERYKKLSDENMLNVPGRYSFCDTFYDQYVIYNKKDGLIYYNLNNIEESLEN